VDLSESARSYWRMKIGHPEWQVRPNPLLNMTGSILKESQSTDVQIFQAAVVGSMTIFAMRGMPGGLGGAGGGEGYAPIGGPLSSTGSRLAAPFNRFYGNIRNRILRGPNAAAGEFTTSNSLVDRPVPGEPSVIVAEAGGTESRAVIGATPTQRGGTVVNPDACTTNCVPVARVTDETLRGEFADPATGEPWAAASQPGQMIYPPLHFRTPLSTDAQRFNSGVPWQDLVAVETDMLARRNSTAVIVGYRNPVTLPNGTLSESGHAFNAVNFNGEVFYIDGQTGVVLNAKQMFDVFMDPVNGYYQGVHVVPTGNLSFWVPSGWFK
jgi:hypothetical protein